MFTHQLLSPVTEGLVGVTRDLNELLSFASKIFNYYFIHLRTTFQVKLRDGNMVENSHSVSNKEFIKRICSRGRILESWIKRAGNRSRKTEGLRYSYFNGNDEQRVSSSQRIIVRCILQSTEPVISRIARELSVSNT